MGFLNGLVKKASDLVSKNPAKVDQGIDKAAKAVDERTGRKHGDKIDKVTDKLHDAVDDLAEDRRRRPR
jgi:hypothetical protein